MLQQGFTIFHLLSEIPVWLISPLINLPVFIVVGGRDPGINNSNNNKTSTWARQYDDTHHKLNLE